MVFRRAKAVQRSIAGPEQYERQKEDHPVRKRLYNRGTIHLVLEKYRFSLSMNVHKHGIVTGA